MQIVRNMRYLLLALVFLTSCGTQPPLDGGQPAVTASPAGETLGASPRVERAVEPGRQPVGGTTNVTLNLTSTGAG